MHVLLWVRADERGVVYVHVAAWVKDKCGSVCRCAYVCTLTIIGCNRLCKVVNYDILAE